LLSGDKAEKTSKLAKELGIDSFKAEQMPEEKLKEIEALQKEGYTAMVGDGINDAPALSKATVGISLSNSTQIAIQSAQVILLNAKSLKMVFESFLISKHHRYGIVTKKNFCVNLQAIIRSICYSAISFSPNLYFFSLFFSKFFKKVLGVSD
jgi:P-type E1-E2 ATPase